MVSAIFSLGLYASLRVGLIIHRFPRGLSFTCLVNILPLLVASQEPLGFEHHGACNDQNRFVGHNNVGSLGTLLCVLEKIDIFWDLLGLHMVSLHIILKRE